MSKIVYWRWAQIDNYFLCTLPSDPTEVETNLKEHQNALHLIQLFEPIFGIKYNSICKFSLYGFDNDEKPMFEYGIKCMIPDNEMLKECIICLFDHSLQYNYIDVIIKKKQYGEMVLNCEHNGIKTILPQSQMYLFNEVLITMGVQFKPMRLVSFYDNLHKYSVEKYKNSGICSSFLYKECTFIQNVLYNKMSTIKTLTDVYKEEAMKAEKAEETVEEIKETVEEIKEETVEEIKETVEEIKEETVEEIKETVEEIKETVEEIKETVEEIKEETVEEIKETVEEKVKETVDEIKEETVDEKVKETVEEKVKETVEEKVEEIKEKVEKKIEEIKEKFEEKVEEKVKEIKEKVKEKVKEIKEKIEEKVEEKVKEIKEKIEEKVEEKVKEIKEKAEKKLNELQHKAEEKVNELIDDSMNAMTDKISSCCTIA